MTLFDTVQKTGGFLPINKNMTKQLGIQTAYFLTYLIEKQSYLENKKMVDGDDYFFLKVEQCQKETNLSQFQQKKCCEKLEDFALLKSKIQSSPPKKFFKIDSKNVKKLLVGETIQRLNNLIINDKKTSKSNIKKLNRIYNIKLDNNKNNNKQKLDTLLSKDNKVMQDCSNLAKPSFFSNWKDKKVSSFEKIQKRNKKQFSAFKKSSGIKTTQPRRTKLHRQLEAIVEQVWNSEPSTTTHRKGTKVWSNIITQLEELAKGKFGKKYFQEEFFNSVPHDMINRQWTIDEIRNAMSNLVLYTKEGYWPNDKKHFKSLPSLIYNQYTGKSFLLKAAVNPPRLISDVILRPLSDKDEQVNLAIKVIVKRVFDDNPDRMNGSRNKVLYFARDVKQEYEKLKRDQKIRYHWPTIARFVHEYIDRLDSWCIEHPNSFLNADGKAFKEYVQYVQEV